MSMRMRFFLSRMVGKVEAGADAPAFFLAESPPSDGHGIRMVPRALFCRKTLRACSAFLTKKQFRRFYNGMRSVNSMILLLMQFPEAEFRKKKKRRQKGVDLE